MNDITKFKTARQIATLSGMGNALALAPQSGKMVSGGGNYVKFTKGSWLAGVNNIQLEDVPFSVDPTSFKHGYISWDQRQEVTAKLGEMMVPVTGPLPDEPDALPNGRWDEQWSVELTALEGADEGVVFTFNSSTHGGLALLKGMLAPTVGERIQNGEDPVAVVLLGFDTYMHPNKKYGKQYTPQMDIAGWRPYAADGAPVPEAAEVVEDDAPFVPDEPVEEKPAPTRRKRRG